MLISIKTGLSLGPWANVVVDLRVEIALHDILLVVPFLFRFVHKFVYNVLLLVLVHQIVARLDLCLFSIKLFLSRMN